MFKTIEGAADCEIRSVIRFLNARNVLPSEIHRQICQVYGDNAISDGIVRKWVRVFNFFKHVIFKFNINNNKVLCALLNVSAKLHHLQGVYTPIFKTH